MSAITGTTFPQVLKREAIFPVLPSLQELGLRELMHLDLQGKTAACSAQCFVAMQTNPPVTEVDSEISAEVLPEDEVRNRGGFKNFDESVLRILQEFLDTKGSSPTLDEKVALEEATNLTRRQITTWFLNKRNRQFPGRKQKYSDKAYQILNSWVDNHKEHPYPTQKEYQKLSVETKLTSTQVRNWFAHIRRRIRKAA